VSGRAITRRQAIAVLGAAGVAGLAAACGVGRRPGATAAKEVPMRDPDPVRMPAVFLAHGSPLLLDDAKWVGELAAWAGALPRPRAILMISAHWLDRPVTLGATQTVPLVYDFYGFEPRHYDVKYRAPGAPDLARRVRELLGADGPVADEPTRGLDHGAYVPLVAMYPRADVPVLQMSIPTMDPAALLELGRRLAPLRDEGVLIVGSGFLTHNLAAFEPEADARPPAWASEFDAWTADALVRRDADALVAYRGRAPGVRMALPTHEHFVPVLVALGASVGASEEVRFPVTGFTYGSFTKRSVQFG
jgi:4,5-DOPA dioxygenase extradiol